MAITSTWVHSVTIVHKISSLKSRGTSEIVGKNYSLQRLSTSFGQLFLYYLRCTTLRYTLFPVHGTRWRKKLLKRWWRRVVTVREGAHMEIISGERQIIVVLPSNVKTLVHLLILLFFYSIDTFDIAPFSYIYIIFYFIPQKLFCMIMRWKERVNKG